MANIVQQATATSGTNYVNSLAATLSTSVTAGSALVMFNGNGANVESITSVTDNRGNTWTKVRSQFSDFRGTAMWVATNVAAGTTTVTANANTFMRQSMVISEISGVTTVQASTNFVDSGYVQNHTASITTTGATFLISGYAGSDAGATYTGSAGFSNLVQIANGDSVAAVQSRDAPTGGSYSSTFSASPFENGSGAILAMNAGAPTPPADVTKQHASPSDTSVILTWAKSSGATSYTVTYGSTTLNLGDVSMTIITGLTNNTSYTFTIKANNTAGSSTGVTATTTPIKPSNGVAPYSWHPFGTQPSISTSSMQSSARTFYNNWMNFVLKNDGMITAMPAGALRIAVPDQNIGPQPAGMLNGTVSEGMGYGMIATAIFSNPQLPAGVYDPTAYAKFNGLLKYMQYYQDVNGLMNWNIGNEGTIYGTGSASDGDYDIALGCLLMHRIHGSGGAVNYASIATSYINAIGTYDFAPSNYPTYPNIALNGDMWGVDTDNYMSDYFRPGWLREFYYHTGDTKWLDRINFNYTQALQFWFTNYLGGVVPDRQTRTNTTVAGFSPFMATYNSVRLGFGIATDFLWNGGSVANSLGKNMMDKMANRFKTLYGTGSAIRSPNYDLDGNSTENYANGSALGMVGPASLTAASNQTFAGELFNALASSSDQNNSYYNGGVGLMAIMAMSGAMQTYRTNAPVDIPATSMPVANTGFFFRSL